uniref:Lactoylglutathione lyase and related lyase n=1 Tax=Sphingomonas sp. JE1 TaxID=1628059 RepID=A0A0D5A094_9SPHN|nr:MULTISPECIES: VOC family protein [unclassified Sphingomonas]AJW29581.1 Lactoylglutathione lyase and related lyase [Sphingomonas sp. JE1]
MFNHVMVGSNDLEKSRAFYDALLKPLGMVDTPYEGRLRYMGNGGLLVVVKPGDGNPATSGNGTNIGLRASSREAVDAAYAGGMANGGTSDGAPGLRSTSAFGNYVAYIRDPDGNKFCLLWPNPEYAEGRAAKAG